MVALMAPPDVRVARHNGKENNERQLRGTREHVTLGKASEPRPQLRKPWTR